MPAIITTTTLLPFVLLMIVSWRVAAIDLGDALAATHAGHGTSLVASRVFTVKATGRAHDTSVPHDHETHTELVALEAHRSYGWLARDRTHGPVARQSAQGREAGHWYALGVERYES